MNNKIISGKELSTQLNSSLKLSINQLQADGKRIPKLVVIQVGDNPASNIYIKHKKRACEEVGMLFEHLIFNEEITEEELVREINTLNNDNAVDGMIVQLPIPKHINEHNIIDSIAKSKDADGFSPFVLGNLMINNTNIYPATPYGILKLLKWKEVNLVGANVVIVGRSNIVGKPLANMLINESSTVTVCNTKTKNLVDVCSNADILISAAGSAHLITKDFVKDGAVVIDVGTNKLDGKFVGDVNTEDVMDKVSLITPVPGGVGPMTIAMLLQNTFELYNKK